MKMQTKTILVACLAIVTFKDQVIGVEVSSKVELDFSDENEDTLSNITFDTTEDSSKSSYTSESVSSVPKQPMVGWRRESELVKPRETRKRRIYAARVSNTGHESDSSSQPKVINNIKIVVNGNDSLPSVNSCKHGICDVSVSSKPDGKGNIVTEVRLSIITNMKPNIQANDVPVIDGLRGVSKESNERPIFRPTNTPNLLHSHLYRDYTPQGYGEPWHQYRRTFQRPSTYWGYQNFGNRGEGFRGRKTWSRERAIVDDKIEPPLSKTKSSDDTNS